MILSRHGQHTMDASHRDAIAAASAAGLSACSLCVGRDRQPRSMNMMLTDAAVMSARHHRGNIIEPRGARMLARRPLFSTHCVEMCLSQPESENPADGS